MPLVPSDVSPALREARYSDASPIAALLQRNGIAEASARDDDWSLLWRENPVVRDQPSVPIGWVIDDNGRIIGYLGNVPLYYHYQGRRLTAAAARGLAVDEAYRSCSMKLVAAFFSQKSVDLLLNTTANAAAGAVFQLCKAKKVHQPGADVALFWILDPRAVAQSVLRKRGHGDQVSRIAGPLFGLGLAIEGRWRRRGPPPRGRGIEVTVSAPGDLDAAFDDWWQRALHERPDCLLADRSRSAMRWHFSRGGVAVREAKVVCAFRAGVMVGHAVITREDAIEIGLRRTRIVDLLAEQDDAAVLNTLLHAATDHARISGSDVLELIGFPAVIRARMTAGNPHSRSFPAWPYWYRAFAPGLQSELASEGAWYASSYDGDASV